MIIDKAENFSLYIKFFPALAKAFDFIEKQARVLKDGKYPITDGMYAIIENSLPKPKKEQKLEAHRKYVDLQYIIEGADVIGWKNISECSDTYKEYDKDKDIVFFNEKADFNFVLNEGNFAILFTNDAHAPLCGDNTVRKCIVKISTEIIIK
jgi:uncharacterized protein, YhcH/YjgK/YiaL family